MIMCVLSDLTLLPLLGGGRKSLYIIIYEIYLFGYEKIKRSMSPLIRGANEELK